MLNEKMAGKFSNEKMAGKYSNEKMAGKLRLVYILLHEAASVYWQLGPGGAYCQ
jgi:hypothetical protein